MRVRSFVLLAVLPLAGCSSCSKKSPGDEVPVVEAPVAAPSSLLAEVAIENPDTFWQHLQRGTGGFVGLLPTSLGGLVSSFGSIDPSIGPVVDGASPAYAAAIARGADDVGWAIAVRLTDLPHARSTLFDGAGAKYDAVADGDFTLLARKGGSASPEPTQAAVSKTGYLVIAPTKADIDEIGPYLVRTMPTHPRATSDAAIDVPGAALKGALHDRLAARWDAFVKEKRAQADEATKAHGRPADFGDPAGILSALDAAVKKRLDVLGDLAAAHLSLEASGASFAIDAILTPNEGNGAASRWTNAMQNGDAAPLLDAPVGPATLLSRASASDRASAPGEWQALVKDVFGTRASDADAKLAHDAAADWESAAGDYVLLELTKEPTPSVIVRTPTQRPDVAARAAHEACELLDRPVLKDVLGSSLKVTSASFGTADVAGLGAATTFTMKRGPSLLGSAAWTTKDGSFDCAAAVDAPLALGTIGHAAKTWRDDPDVTARALAAGPNASFALASRPFAASDPNASAFTFWGRDGSRIHGGVFASDVVLREAIRVLGR